MSWAADGIELRRMTAADPAAVMALYLDAAWVEPGMADDFVTPMLRGSFAVIGAFDGARLIGMGRAISDGASDGYIQDIVVHSDYRRRGIGGAIVTRLVEALREAGVDWIGLVAAPGAEKLYASLGFRPLTGHVAMKLER